MRQVYNWVEKFCERTNASGQLCFDFMLNHADGHLYSFECNPRTSSVILEYHDHPGFAEALYNPEVLQSNTTVRMFAKNNAFGPLQTLKASVYCLSLVTQFTKASNQA